MDFFSIAITKYFFILIIIPFLPIIIGAIIAKNEYDQDKASPFIYDVFRRKNKPNKVVKRKKKPSFFHSFLTNTLLIYFLAIGLLIALFSIFVALHYANVYLSAAFQNYPWKFFGQMYNFFGSIFIIYLIGSLNFAFWMGILPNTIDKVISLFRLKTSFS